MAEYISDYLNRIEEWRKAQSSSSQLLTNSLELIDAALWLIAGSRHAQAVSMLHNAVELIFKAELERVHRVLIADSRQLDYKSLKSLLKDAFLNHPQGKGLKIDDYDLERTITFTEALSRVKDLYPVVGQWERKLKDLQFVRNDIVHYGSDPNKADDYTFLIAVVAFPFLVEFLNISNGIDLKKLVGNNIYQEINVANEVCMELMKTNQTSFRNALKTVKYAMLYRNVEFPAPIDRNGFKLDNFDRELETAESLRSELHGRWSGEIISVTCAICGSIHAFAEIDDIDIEEPVINEMIPHSLACAVCGLDLSREDGLLPKIHYGPISVEDIEKELEWRYG